eukprot:4936730-Pleurochrysis_carterae.AAC.1
MRTDLALGSLLHHRRAYLRREVFLPSAVTLSARAVSRSASLGRMYGAGNGVVNSVGQSGGLARHSL